MIGIVSLLISLMLLQYSYCGPIRLQKRAAFYIANETACVVDNTVYSNGDPIPTDDPCEACKCRPPGFACVLKHCEVKPGCRAVRRTGNCCPDYICGCEHNGRMYRDGDEIRDSQNPCYTCHCMGSSIACAFEDCLFRVDCAAEYVKDECCPRYTNCTTSKNSFEDGDSYSKEKEGSIDTLVPSSVIVPGVSYVEDTTEAQNIDTTVVDIFEVKTEQPVRLQINPETASIDKVVNTEDSVVEETDKSIPKTEISPIEFGISDVKTAPDDETISEAIESKMDEALADIQFNKTQTIAPISMNTDSDVTESGTFELVEKSSQTTPRPIIENVNVEPDEPSNNLESENLPSEYGKSLKFDDSKEQESKVVLKELKDGTESKEEKDETDSKEEKDETDSKEQKDETDSKEQKDENVPKEQNISTEQTGGSELKEQEVQTQQPLKLLHTKETFGETLTTPKNQEEIVSPTSPKISSVEEKLVNSNLTSNSESTEKILNYNAEVFPQTETVESVTTVVGVKEDTKTAITSSPNTPTVRENLFKFGSDNEEQKLPDILSVQDNKTNSSETTGVPKFDSSSNSPIHITSATTGTEILTTFSSNEIKSTTLKIE